MRAMIMAAGVGTRLMPLTAKLPKPMVPIGNKPTMEHLVRHLVKFGFYEQVANLWYLPQEIESYFGSGEAFGAKLSYSPEKELQGTAGGVRQVQDFLGGATFLVTSGDGLTDLDLEAFLAFHQKKKALASIALFPVEDPSPFGVALTDRQGKIVGFQEKPKREEAQSNLVNTGIYLFEPEIFSLIPQEGSYDFGRELFPKLVELEAPFYGFEMKGYWSDIGSIETYRESCLDAITGKIKLDLEAREIGPGIFAAGDVELHPDAELEGPILLGENCKVGPKARLIGPLSLGRDVEIGADATIARSVLWDQVQVGAGAVSKDSVLGSEARLDPGEELVAGVLAAQVAEEVS